MEQMIHQLASPLARDSIRLETSVASVNRDSVQLVSGERIAASKVIVAADPWNAAKLLGDSPPVAGYCVAVVYFAAERPPVNRPVLVLNGDHTGPVNSLCVPSQVADEYAPAGESLVSVAVLGAWNEDGRFDPSVESEILDQLSTWFGPDVQTWRHLKTFSIPNALPVQRHIQLSPTKATVREDGIVICGDYTDVASIQGAMRSGRLAAQLVMDSISSGSI
jgi:protoporphyrinogen oxidase